MKRMSSRPRADFEERAERRIDVAMVVAFLAGTLSLIVALRTWNARVYLDLETLLGIVDAVLILVLAVLLAKGWWPATYFLLLLATFGIGFTFWRGLPPLAILPPLGTAIIYLRAVLAYRQLAEQETDPPTGP